MELNTKKDQELFSKIHDKCWILQTSLEVTKMNGKYRDSFVKLKKEIIDLMIEFFCYGMRRELLADEGKVVSQDMDLYINFINDLLRKSSHQCSSLLKKIPIRERERKMLEIRENILAKEREFCKNLYFAHIQFPKVDSATAMCEYEKYEKIA